MKSNEIAIYLNKNISGVLALVHEPGFEVWLYINYLPKNSGIHLLEHKTYVADVGISKREWHINENCFPYKEGNNYNCKQFIQQFTKKCLENQLIWKFQILQNSQNTSETISLAFF